MKPSSNLRGVQTIGAALLFLSCSWLASAHATTQNSSVISKPRSAKKTSSKKHAAVARKTSVTSATTDPSAKAIVRAASGKRSLRKKRSARVRGQRNIDAERAQAIQEALIREHYLSGAATGKWNQASEDAMRRYQGDHGWQTKTVPDSRALIKLGLGPSKDHLLNPESAMTTAPDAPRAAALSPVSHSPDAAVPAGKAPTAEPVPTGASSHNPPDPH